MKSRVILVCSLMLITVVLIMLFYAFSPYIDAYRANKHMDVSKVKLLMTLSEAEQLIGKGSNMGGFGAEFYRYQNDTITIAYRGEGLLKGRVGYLETSNPDHSIYGIHPGDSPEGAKAVLMGYGFKEDFAEDYYKKGSTRISVYANSIRIHIDDWTLRGRIY